MPTKPKFEDKKEALDFLIKDEEEAIKGYQEKINLFNAENEVMYIQKLNEIMADELRHKEDLECLKHCLENDNEHTREVVNAEIQASKVFDEIKL